MNPQVSVVDRAGAEAIGVFAFVGSVAAFGARAVVEAARPPYELREIVRHVYQFGYRSAPLILAAGFAVGVVLSMHTRASLERFGAEAMIPAGLAIALISETGPLVAALLVSGRVGAGIGAEIGAMKVTEQIDALEASAVDAFKYLAVTRIIALMIAMPLLTIMMDFAGILGGYVAEAAVSGMSWQQVPRAVLQLHRLLGHPPRHAEDRGVRLSDRGRLELSRLHDHSRHRGGRRGVDAQRGHVVDAGHRERCHSREADLLLLPAGVGMSAVRFDHVSKAFGTQTILDDLSFEVPAGRAFCLLGRSGTGKSVTLRHIVGLVRPDSGRVFVEDRDVTTLAGRELAAARKHMGFLFQNAALFDSMSVGDNVAFPMRRHTDWSNADIRDRATRKLADVGLEQEFDKMPADLSGGMKKRAGLARAMALDPSILLVDEPSAGLDPITAGEIDALLVKTKQAGTTLVVVTHNIPSARVIGDTFGVLHGGRLLAAGTIETLDASEEPMVQAFMRSHGGG